MIVRKLTLTSFDRSNCRLQTGKVEIDEMSQIFLELWDTAAPYIDQSNSFLKAASVLFLQVVKNQMKHLIKKSNSELERTICLDNKHLKGIHKKRKNGRI